MNRQKMFLLILLVLLVAAIMYAFMRMPRQKTVGKLKYASGSPAEIKKTGGIVKSSDGKKLNLELLDKPLPRFSGFKRNIFWLASYETKKKLPLPPPPPPPPPPPTPLPPPPPPSSSEIAQTEMAKFTFLGFLLKDHRKTIFLSKDQEIFVVKKGDKIANKYEITNISDEAMTIHPASGSGEIVIPLMENMPLKARKK